MLGLWLILAAAVPARAEPSPALVRRLSISAGEVRALGTRKAAELLVERIRRECGSEISGGRPVGDDAELIMMVPASALAPIIAHGFRNQHETSTTGGFERAADRFETEQELAMLRLPYDAPGRELLPKYALVSFSDPDFGTYALPTRYGSVALVFKDEVRVRSTWTYVDTLDHSLTAGRFGKGGHANPVLARTFQDARDPRDPRACGAYCEAQIWGGLDWSDVDYAMIPDSEPVPGALVRARARVYRYSAPPSTGAVVAPDRTAQYVREDEVSAGAAAVEPPAGPAASNYLKSLEEARGSDAALIAGITASTAGTAGRARLIGDLAARPSSAAAARELGRLLRDSDAQARVLALGGLAGLAWNRFKPFLLEALDDPDWTVEITGIALTAEHRADADVARRLDALRAASARPNDAAHLHAEDVAEWLSRLDAPRFCGP